MNAKAYFKRLPNMVAVVKEETLSDKLPSVEAKEVIGTLANTLAETKMQTLS